ncbi:MAG: nucleotide exchange factor GrpE [Spirochaetes bacterium]|nr:nucleotide exchange factor GrpE [Spirochaetota bacterium]
MSKHTKEFKTREEKTVPGVQEPDRMVPVIEPQPAEVGQPAAAGKSAAAEKSAEAEKPDEAKASDECKTQETELAVARKEIETLKAEVAELNDKFLRKLADEVNFRKRMQREKEEGQKYGVASLLSDLIPVLDDFDRGIAVAEDAKNYEQVHEGILLIRRQLSQMLENKYALKRFDSKGQPFDPNRHEALFAEPSDVEEPVVSEEYLPGYSLHDRMLRPAKVRVKIPAPKKAEADQEPAEEAGQA